MPYCSPIARPAAARPFHHLVEIVDLHVHLLSERDLRECEQHQRRPALGGELRRHLDEVGRQARRRRVLTGIRIVWNSTSTPGPVRAATSRRVRSASESPSRAR